MLRLLFKIERIALRKISHWRKKWALLKIRSLYPDRCLFDGLMTIGPRFRIIFDLSSSSVKIGNNLTCRADFEIRSGRNGKLQIGENVFFNNSCAIHCLHEITIGNNNSFGENVRFYDHNHQFRDKSKLISEQDYTEGPITIGNNCWIASNVIILKGVVIGDNCVIGANCVIHHSIPSGSLVFTKQQLEIRPI